jgi:O-acetyl-ADP-ribose deacetylase (regulator of RNase III)
MALGYTAKGTNRMIPNEPELSVECIGVPAYQPGKLGRSVGFIFDENAVEAMLQTLVGDATEPRGSGPRIIAHIVNDRARSWGGRGIASAIRKKWPQAHDEFVESVAAHGLKLGRAIPHKIGDELWVVDMVAQAGYRQPKLKYGALQLCLDQLRDFAKEVPASVHMPRIGTGAAGGNWSVIAEQIETTLCDAGIRVTVYDLPTTSGQQSPSQTSLFRD